MVIAAFLHMKAFSYEDFAGDLTHKTRVLVAFWDSLSPMDIYQELVNAPKAVKEHKKRTREKKSQQSLNHLAGEFDDSISLVDMKASQSIEELRSEVKWGLQDNHK